MEWRPVAYPARPQPRAGGVERPFRRGVHRAVGVHGRRGHYQQIGRADAPGRAVERQHVADPAHPQPGGGRCLERRGVPVAVGNSAAGKTVAERWNGTSWQIQQTPSPAGGGFLVGVACTSAASCTATGGSVAGEPLAERFNGTSWQIQHTPNPAQGGLLYSVACTSAASCMAVGNSGAGNLVEQLTGAGWQILPAPSPSGAQFAVLGTVACAAASTCIAAGTYQDSSGAFQTLAERWNGTSWAVQPMPPLAGGMMGQLYGVACTSATSCLAVGLSSPNLFNNQSPATLAEQWDGSAWRVQRIPSPPGAAAGNLNAASCVSRSACVAVGNTSNSRGTSLTTAQRWSGHS